MAVITIQMTIAATAIKDSNKVETKAHEEQIICYPLPKLLGAGVLRYDLPLGWIESRPCFIIITVSPPKADKVEVEQWYLFPDPWRTGGIRRTTEDEFVSLRDRQIDSRLRSQVRPSPSSLLFQVSQPRDARGSPDSQLLTMIFSRL